MLYLADGRSVCSFRNGVDQLFYNLFTRRDWIELSGPPAYELARHSYVDLDPSEATVVGFQVSAGSLRDRLDVMGVDIGLVREELTRLIAEETRRKHDLLGSFSDAAEVTSAITAELSRWIEIDADSWLVQLRRGIQQGDRVERFAGRDDLGSASWLMSIWEYHDPRFQLRAVLEVLPDDEVITLDLADLIESGWLDPTVEPRDVADEFVSYATRGGLAPIVLTEGRFDAEVLAAAVELRKPHLADFIRFPDFGSRPEGGAAALRQTVRAFASAGIPNRVVALFDNDSAARDVLRGLAVDHLPRHIAVTTLPSLSLAASYPTRGPQGHLEMDVNGLAVSIELFLGRDVLTQDGALNPIEWGGYLAGVSAYQGEVAGKRAIQQRFRAKVEQARDARGSLGSWDWSGIDLLLDHVLASIRTASEADLSGSAGT